MIVECKGNIGILNKIGIFAGSLLITVMAVYFYSPVTGSYADETAKVRVGINTISSLWLDNNFLNFDITPTDRGAYSIKELAANGFTNSNAGFELYFSSSDNSTDMTHRSSSINDVISSNFTETNLGLTEIPMNSWAYHPRNTSKAIIIPPANNPAKVADYNTSTTSTSGSETALEIGVRVNNSIASGYYSKDVKFSMVTHEPIIPIQDFDCASLDAGDEIRVTDTRDSNQYMISKLNDGRCWMTENLRLKNKTITNEDSDISAASYTVPDSSETMINSLTDPALYDTGNTSYGVYYNYVATSAGTITTMNNGDTLSESICPKGWTIPSRNDWLALFNAYSITNDSAGSTILRATPINMVYSGLYSNDADEGGLGVLSQGEAGLYWSTQTSYTYGRRESTYISDTSATVYHALYRYNGLAIRCIRRNS
jgi:uncharacterized protein (TIGR02145 family)